MKLLILITISIISLNVFSADLGEDQKSECPFLNQSSKRDAKPVEAVESEISKEGAKVISK
ncbi:MAG: hypothetical protein PHY93_01845 [Bacteriovorax sp.]|nr:hypothetical protein [Bacteriovorax sp.]